MRELMITIPTAMASRMELGPTTYSFLSSLGSSSASNVYEYGPQSQINMN